MLGCWSTALGKFFIYNSAGGGGTGKKSMIWNEWKEERQLHGSTPITGRQAGEIFICAEGTCVRILWRRIQQEGKSNDRHP